MKLLPAFFPILMPSVAAFSNVKGVQFCFAKPSFSVAAKCATTSRVEDVTSVGFLPAMRPGVSVDTSIWTCICPSMLDQPHGIDVRLQWKREDAGFSMSALSYRMADSFMVHISEHLGCTPSNSDAMKNSLVESLETFISFCNRHLRGVSGYSARIAATRGSPSTKCPAWHQDHVPIRWIQSLVGPGCEWVDVREWTPAEIVDEDSSATGDLELHGESIEHINRRRVDPSLPIHQGTPGEAVMLVGRSWPDHCLDPSIRGLSAVVHKSPSGFLPWQGRVLLTIDIITDD